MSSLRAALILVLAGSATPALAEEITCESHQNRPEACGTVQPGSSVRLVQQLSNSPCVEGRNWGTGDNRDSIWVSGGCRAVFDVQPPYDSAAGRGQYGADNSRYVRTNRSPQWRRGFGDGQRGVFDIRVDSRDYRDGYRAGEDAAQNENRYSRAQNPTDDHEARGDQPDPISNISGPRYASGESPRRIARRACIEQAASAQPYERYQIRTNDVHWLGRGMLSVEVDTPGGPLTCTVDRDGNVQSIDNR